MHRNFAKVNQAGRPVSWLGSMTPALFARSSPSCATTG